LDEGKEETPPARWDLAVAKKVGELADHAILVDELQQVARKSVEKRL
jgi:hypothetical protein